MNDLELQIIKVGQLAIDAYEKGNYVDFCHFQAKQMELKEKLQIEELKKLDLKDLIEVKW